MTEPSEAALRLVKRLVSDERAEFYIKRVGENGSYSRGEMALARQIQHASDVAKVAVSWAKRLDFNDPELTALQSLILPDEPCKHETVFRCPPTKAFTCTKCGAVLKLTEAGDD